MARRLLLVEQATLEQCALSLDAMQREIAEVKASEARYRDLIENASDILWTTDLQGTITTVNRAFEDAMGYSRQDLVGTNLSIVLTEESAVRATRMRVLKLHGHAPNTFYTVDCIARDGEPRVLEVNTSLILVDGEPVGVQGMARDITERKRLEEQLLQAQKLEGIGRLAGGIAHDFNNLLTSIVGYARLAGDALEQGHPAHTALQRVRDAADQASDLTNQLLAYARKQASAPRPIDLNAMILAMQRILRPLVGEDITLNTELAATIWKVRADAIQMEQLLVNLVVNARDAMPNGGHLAIRTANVGGEGTTDHGRLPVRSGEYVMLSITGTGPASHKQTAGHPTVPNPISSGREAPTTQGLATCYSIVKHAGGHIWIRSAQEAGTTIEVWLPRLVAGDSTDFENELAALPRGSATVLLAEDEPLVRELAATILRELGYLVLVATDGTDALRVAEEFRGEIHLLVSDVVMPRSGGKQIAQRLRESRPDMQVLYVSGYSPDTIHNRGLLEADERFLQKPFSQVELANMVREALDESIGAPTR